MLNLHIAWRCCPSFGRDMAMTEALALSLAKAQSKCRASAAEQLGPDRASN